MSKPHWSRKLRALGACDDAVEWAATQPSYAEAWETCQRGDWLLWLLGRVAGPFGSPSHREIVGAVSACARTALPIFEAAVPGDGRVRACLDLLDRYAGGEVVSPEQIQAAAGAAWVAAGAASAAAGAAWVAAGAASAAAWSDVATRTASASGAATRPAALAHCADIVRTKAKRPGLGE